MHLLPLLHERVKLRDAFQRQFVHEIDFVGVGHVLVLELDDGHGEGRRKHQDLPVCWQELEEVFDDGLELRAQELVRLVHHEHLALLQVAHILIGEVEDAPGRRDDDVHLVVQAHDVFPEARAACRHHALHVHVLAKLLHHRRRLQGELACGHQDQALDDVLRRRALFEQRYHESTSLACSVLRAREDALARQGHRDAVLLDRRRLLVALLENTHQQLPL
mmetsp:Transcript_46826/g.142151  ORF Transcript_46826/g.142151 Transcript_46826/m.142151 type:complete len:220 (-) Transcript_46826:205-864(-)